MPASSTNTAHSLETREREIFRRTVEEYISSAKPVGSKILVEKYFENLSSATVRHVLSHLEELGFLRQPHASAGRIPTEAGYRFFIHSLIEPQPLTMAEQTAIADGTSSNPMESLRHASRLLSNYSHQIGLVTSPRLEGTVFRQIQFVRINDDKILAIFIARNGLIEQRVIRWEKAPPQDDLWKMASYLNDILSDLPLKEVRKRIDQEMQDERNRYNSLVRQALELRELFLQQQEDLEVFIEGQTTLIEQPEFSNQGKIRELMGAFEQKQKLLQILDIAERNPQESASIFLGRDLDQKEFADLAFIARTYGTKEQPLGTVAVAGPTRMDYCKIVPIVNFAAESLSGLFKRKNSES